MILVSCCSLYQFCQPPGAGAFSGEFTTNLARQCRAFSRALKIEKLKAPLFRGPEGPWLKMTGALYNTIILCPTSKIVVYRGTYVQSVLHLFIR